MPRDHRPLHIGDIEASGEQKNMFSAFVSDPKASDISNLLHDNMGPNNGLVFPEASKDDFSVVEALKDDLPGIHRANNGSSVHEASQNGLDFPSAQKDGLAVSKTLKESFPVPEPSNDGLAFPEASKDAFAVPEASKDNMDVPGSLNDGLAVPEASRDSSAIQQAREVDNISTSREKKMPVVKIRVKKSAATSRAQEVDNQTSQGGPNETDRGASSSLSVDAPNRNFAETVSISNHNIEEVNSCHDLGSRMTASIGSAKVTSDGDEVGKELQCTADSCKAYAKNQPDKPSSPSLILDNSVDVGAQKFASLQSLSDTRRDLNGRSLGLTDSLPWGNKSEKKKDKEKKRKREDHKGHRDDPKYLERKRLKKEKKKEKEIAKLLNEAKLSSMKHKTQTSLLELLSKKENIGVKSAAVQLEPMEPSGSKLVSIGADTKPDASEGTTTAPKIRIKIKNRMLNKS